VKLWRVQMRRACFGILVEHGTVVEAAPICGWATGQPWTKVKRWLASKGATGEVISHE